MFGPLDEKDRKMALLQSICLQPKHETKMSNVEEVEKVRDWQWRHGWE